MALIDTGVLLCAVDQDSPHHAAARKLLRSHVEGSELWHLAWQNIFEFLRTVTHPLAFQRSPLYIDEAVSLIKPLLECPSLQILHPGPRHFEIFAEVAAHTPGIRGAAVHDARLVAVMMENSVKKIYSADKGLQRFKQIEVVSPFA